MEPGQYFRVQGSLGMAKILRFGVQGSRGRGNSHIGSVKKGFGVQGSALAWYTLCGCSALMRSRSGCVEEDEEGSAPSTGAAWRPGGSRPSAGRPARPGSGSRGSWIQAASPRKSRRGWCPARTSEAMRVVTWWGSWKAPESRRERARWATCRGVGVGGIRVGVGF